MDGGPPATPGPVWGEEPQEGARLPVLTLSPAPHLAGDRGQPSLHSPGDPARTAQLRTASGPAYGQLQLTGGSGSSQLLFVVTSTRLQPQISCPSRCGVSVGLSCRPGSTTAVPTPVCSGSSSAPAPVCACSNHPGFCPGRKSVTVRTCI